MPATMAAQERMLGSVRPLPPVGRGSEQPGAGQPGAGQPGSPRSLRPVDAAEQESQRWLPAARAGDATAMDALLANLRPAVLRYCAARLGDRHRAEDVTQEVLVAVATSLPRYEERGLPFAAYVFRIAQRRVADAHRGAARSLTVMTGELPDAASDVAGPEEEALARERAALAHTLLDRLPEQQRDVLLLRVIGGLSAAETAQSLGLSTVNVRVVQHRALARLRRLATEKVLRP